MASVELLVEERIDFSTVTTVS